METLNNLDTLLNIRTIINNNFTEAAEEMTEIKEGFDKKLRSSEDVYTRDSANYGRLFSDTSEFILWYGLVSHSADYTQTGSTSLKISVDASTNTTSAAQYQGLNWNLSQAKNILIRFYVPVLSGLSKFQLRFSASSSMTSYLQWEQSRWKMVQGWNEILISLDHLTSAGDATTSILSAIQTIQLSVTGSADASIYFDSIWVKHKEHANVIFNFDDGMSSVYTIALPILKQHGFVGNVGVISNVVGTGNYMTETQLADLHNLYRWDLFNHTATHTDLTTYTTTDEIKTELDTCRDWLETRGYSRASRYIAYPYGNYNSNVLTVMEEGEYLLGRTVSAETEVSPPIQPYGLKIFELTNTTLADTYEPVIDKLVATGGTLILLLHNIAASGTESTTYLTQNLKSLVEYIYSKDCNVITISEWINQMNL